MMEKQRRPTGGKEMRNWSELPREFLSPIARRLEAAADRARFSGVCRNWSSIAKSEINYLPPNPPWLMLTQNLEADERIFVSDHGKERFSLDLPRGRGSRCIGSSGCWLVILDAACNVCILNPFSRLKIDLPSLLSIDDSVVGYHKDEDSDKVILYFPNSQSPLEDDFTAVTIYTSLRKLAYAKKGTKSWQTIDSTHGPFADIIFFQDKLYALNCNGKIFEFNVHCNPDEKPNAVRPVPVSYPLDNIGSQRHLVEFQGKLFQVLNLDDYQRGYSFKTMGFQVFMLDFTTGGWLEVDDIGQFAIFLGFNAGLLVLATSNSTFKPNCIYFSTDRVINTWSEGRMGYIGDVGVFNLADCSIVPYYKGPYSDSNVTRPVWIIPTSLYQNQSHCTDVQTGTRSGHVQLPVIDESHFQFDSP